MQISSRVRFDKEYRTNLEKIRHFDEEDMITFLVGVAALNEHDMTPEREDEVKRYFTEFLREKPKSKLECLQEAVTEVSIAIGSSDSEKLSISRESCKTLLAVVTEVLEDAKEVF